MRRWLLLLPLVALFTAAGVALFTTRPAADLGKPVADLDLPSVRDPAERIELSELVGRTPVVLNFWASWCEPCKQEAPEFKASAERHGGDVTFLGVSILDGPGPARRFMDKAKIGYQSVSDTRGVTAKRFGVTGVPETIFVDARGIVVGRYIGAFRPGELEPLVADLLALEPGQLLDIRGRGQTRPVP
jgi:cytochrome c biogenesis protein CcmG/thiol:disulfide interchange protein DsbE